MKGAVKLSAFIAPWFTDDSWINNDTDRQIHGPHLTLRDALKKHTPTHTIQQISTCMITFHVLEYFIIVKMEFKMNEKQHFFPFFLPSLPCLAHVSTFLSFFFLDVTTRLSCTRITHISYLLLFSKGACTACDADAAALLSTLSSSWDECKQLNKWLYIFNHDMYLCLCWIYASSTEFVYERRVEM